MAPAPCMSATATRRHRQGVETGARCQPPVELPFGRIPPYGLAVDAAGKVYVASDGRVLQLAVGAPTPKVLPFGGGLFEGVAVDGGRQRIRLQLGRVLKLDPRRSQPDSAAVRADRQSTGDNRRHPGQHLRRRQRRQVGAIGEARGRSHVVGSRWPHQRTKPSVAWPLTRRAPST